MEPRPKKQSKQGSSKVILSVLAAILIAGLSFFGGVKYEKNAKTNVPTTTASANSPFGGGGGGRFGGANRVVGQVTAISASSITVQDTRTNASSTLAITSNTTITDNGQTVSYTDIQTGDTVFVTEDSSNTSQASRILVNPSFGGGPGGGPSSGGSSTTTNTTSLPDATTN